jgi:hypothetical protein
MKTTRFRATMLATSICLISATTATAQPKVAVYPAQGQSPAQQSADDSECQRWAAGQSGYDPANPQSNSGGKGVGRETLRGGARGAAAGAAIGAIAGDAGKGAAIGATAGGLKRGMQQRDQNRSGASQNPSETQYTNAFIACMQGRGYSAK